MYQVFDAPDIFGRPRAPLADDDFTLQRRYRGPDEGGGGGGGPGGGQGGGGGGIDDVLGWLGLPGGGRAVYDDPGGGGPGMAWGPAGLRCVDDAGLGQLMMMETENNNVSDESEYFDYSCLSSGLISPDVESEFFGAPYAAATGHHLPFRGLDQPPFWAFNPSSCATLPDRPPSPLFGDFRCVGLTNGSDASYPAEMTSCDLLFDSEAEAKVKEIARYLASFEVQPWSLGASSQRSLASSCSTPGSDPNSPFEEIGSLSGPNRNNNTSGHKVSCGGGVDGGSGPVGFFHAGFDDSCGLETTMVNPNDVFPDRTTDHQYAFTSRPVRDQAPPAPPRSRQPSRASHRTSPPVLGTPPKTGRASSVLEALLRSTEPIDPNKGSGAAVAMDDVDDGDFEAELVEQQRGLVGRRTPERMLKKLLTGEDTGGWKGHRGHGEEPLRTPAAKKMTSLSCGRAFPGFGDVKMEKNCNDESELARELGEIMREQTARNSNSAAFSLTSDYRSTECFRCN